MKIGSNGEVPKGKVAAFVLNLSGRDSIFVDMKRVFSFIALSVLLLPLPVMAQTETPVPTVTPPVNTAAIIAAREEAEERYKRMAADLQAVQSDNEALHAKIASLEQQIQNLRDAQAKPVDNSAVQGQLKLLAQKIEEVDKKRLEDKDTISDEIRKSIGKLESTLQGVPALPTRESHDTHEPRPKVASTVDSPAIENGYSYPISSGDRLDLIVKAYNKDFRARGLKTITMKQVREANPNVNWNRLLVGQKIVIPRPDGG